MDCCDSRQSRDRNPIEGLYLITDDDADGRLVERVRAALRGGVRVVQYREKRRAPAEQVPVAAALREICHVAGALFLVNDSAEVALRSGADGVHLGQADMGPVDARRMLGDGKIIGVSTRTVDQALRAEAEGADYIGLGSIYPTDTKADARLVGLETLKTVRRAVRLPVVAIGGVKAENAADVIDAGADGIAVVSAVMADPFPCLAARELALLFNRRGPLPRGRVLTVAGSDSGGGAGIQADLKTITLLGAYGMSAITSLTAQNTLGVQGIHPVPVEFVAEQIDTVLTDLGTDTVKTGMLFSAQIVAVAARVIEKYGLLAVVDPVMIAKGGASLLQREALESLVSELLPQAYLLTPNLPEAEALTGIAVKSEADMERAGEKLRQMGARNVLLKGGHLPGEPVDLLWIGGRLHRFPGCRFETRHTHGTGCTYGAAVATFLAQGDPLPVAVGRAKDFIQEAIRTAAGLGGGHGPVNHWAGAKMALKS